MSEIIKPADYTPLIQGCIKRLEYRMEATLTDYEPNDFLAIRDGDVVFVLANPVLGEEPIYDDFGQVTELVPMRNFTLLYYDGPPETGPPQQDFILKVRLPRLRVLRSDLCLKIEPDKVGDCDPDDLESVAVNDWKRQLESLIALCRRQLDE